MPTMCTCTRRRRSPCLRSRAATSATAASGSATRSGWRSTCCDSPQWTRERIQAAMNGDKTLTVALKNRIRVFIVYGTALAREQGDILFFDDIYRHDQRLEKALRARRVLDRDTAIPAGTGRAVH